MSDKSFTEVPPAEHQMARKPMLSFMDKSDVNWDDLPFPGWCHTALNKEVASDFFLAASTIN